MSTQSTFKDRVLTIVRAIPAGSVLTYGQVAAAAGNEKAARAVGTIMRGNQHSFLNTDPDNKDAVPCHRVVAANNRLGGFNGGEEAKLQLLRAEGWNIRVDLRITK
ncbi:MAG: MGMT family protein [Patescibacteria group bacterium]